MIFEKFLKGEIYPVSFGENLDVVISKLAYPKVCLISKENELYAVYSQGVEYLFDMNKLCLIQFEISRIKQVYINQNKITKNTTYDEFKDYLKQIQLKYEEDYRDNQKILLINTGVKVYFDQVSNRLATVMRNW
ncbi:hypothetical protein [Thorsellia anophelis]|uniref:Uncharacterized protein n=1 Tax=Thorsellia anophelis DSM 18579 TaxID=1123402 RepID=A0A1I0FMA3_9GAMM|nr:hypothetical protein [Thorsellia anophelis]SET59367.1 hypothetical protein SAMN02583745_02817 [Thorsellia anophelis DSM 18579]